MKKTTIALISAACIAAVATPALAQGVRGPHHPARHDGGASLIETFDTDGDGQLTQAEVDAFRANRLAAFDTNNDGRLSLEEYQALWLDAYRERMVDEFQRHDDDGDAMVTVEEFGEPFANLVARRDANNDGILTADELQPRRHRDIGNRDRDDDRRGPRRGPQPQ